MKKTLILIFLLFAVVVAAKADQTLDLTNIKVGSKVYSTQINPQPQEGVVGRVLVTLPKYKSAVAFASRNEKFDGINQLQPWQSSDITTILTKRHNLADVAGIGMPTKEIFSMALELESGEYLIIQPLALNDVMSWIEVKSKYEIEIVCGNIGDAAITECEDRAIFAYSVCGDLYSALSGVWGGIISNKEIEGNTAWRSSKVYPESYRYLGWCSWEQYKLNINEAVLLNAIAEIEESEVPVRWVLIDDGHQENENRALMSFVPSKEKFPNGWSKIIAQRSEKIKWLGLWHCMFGQQGGVSANHTMEEFDQYLIQRPNKSKIIGDNNEGSKLFFEMLVSSVSEPGFDFAKVDFQTRLFANTVGLVENPVLAYHQNAHNLEVQAKEKLNGMMNCMALNLPSIFNTRYSATTRVSLDYQLNNSVRAISHIYQSFQNSAWVGQTVWPDHDMFHSSDVKFGRLMAVSKAMSGAPVYISDAPLDMQSEFIAPLAYSDGELLRPLAPGVPLPESFFADALLGGDEYRVIAPMSDKSAAIVAYNISTEYPEVLSIAISEEDYKYADAMVQPYPGVRELPKEGLVYYDWYEKRGGKLSSEYRVDVKSAEDRLVLLTEIENGWSVVGLEDKYLSAVAVTSVKSSPKSIDITVVEGGALLVYSETPIKSGRNKVDIESLGGGLYRIAMSSNQVSLKR